MNHFFRKTLKVFAWAILFASLFVLAINIWVVASTESKVLEDIDQLPDSSVALVLGTSNKLIDGSPNPFFLERIHLASALYRKGKIAHFLLSGDNRSKYYNEPEEMRKALIKVGVPDSIITLDFAGLRTLDSIVRCKEIFGQNKIIIVTQPFHCYRALFISDYYDIEAVALLTISQLPYESTRVNVREWFARTMAVIDLYVLKTAPRHLGGPEPLEI
jgi:SanA protein